MPSIDKTSVRDNVEQLKADFASLNASNNLSSETKALILGLLTLVDIMLVIFMEKKTAKNSKNSSIPSSQTEPDESSTNASITSKKRQLTKGSFSQQKNRVIERTVTVDFCDTCAEDLREQTADAVERRTTIDIVFETITTHVDAESKTCPHCDAVNKGRFPSNMQGPLQYGNGVKAYVLNLMIVQMVALNRVQQMMFALLGQMMSEATLLKYMMQLSVCGLGTMGK